MKPEEIARINALARKAKTPEGLTPAEKEEQTALRKEYIEEFRRSTLQELNSIVIQHPDGTRTKLKKKD